MALTPREKQLVGSLKAQGKTDREIAGEVANLRLNKPSTPVIVVPETKPKTPAVKETFEDYKKIGENALEQFGLAGENITKTFADSNKSLSRKVLDAASESFRRGGRFIGGSLLGLGKMALSQEAEDKVSEATKATGADIVKQAKAFYEELKTGDTIRGDSDKKAAQFIDSVIRQYKNNEQFRGYIDAAGGFAEGLAEIVGGRTALGLGEEAVNTGVRTTKQAVRTLESELDIPYFKETEEAVAEAIENTKTVSPTITQAVEPVTEEAGLLKKVSQGAFDIAVTGAEKTAQTYRDLREGVTHRIRGSLDRQALEQNKALPIADVEQNIGNMYINSVSPGVKGKKQSLNGLVANNKSAVSAIKSITESRPTLEFRDLETNQVVKGELPSNLWEFGGAITHQKSQVYKEVLNRLGNTADEPVDQTRIINAMGEIIEDPVYDGMPQVKNRAQEAFSQFVKNDYTPAQIERLIQLENDRLQAYYRGAGTQADAIVSAIIANNLRDILDETVEAATGSGISELKKSYGSLKAIERDVVHRALHNAQAREAGLVDMFGIRTIGDIAAGAAGDFGALKRGAAQVAGEAFIKALNDRDALVNRMFLVADQAYKIPAKN